MWVSAYRAVVQYAGMQPDVPKLPAPLRWALVALAVLSLAVGIAGIFIPGLPTTVFILLAGWAAARSSPQLSAWLRSHRLFGPMLRNWQAGGYVSRRAKYSAAVMMVICGVLLLATGSRLWLSVAVCVLMAGIFAWLWRRPEPPV
jgi:uncharacterized membrane protein YbaN (DUF454 family)